MFYIDIRKTFIYNNDKYSSKRSENNLPSIKQSVETSVINDKGELVSKRANKTLSWGAEPSYIKLYLQDILYLSDILQEKKKEGLKDKNAQAPYDQAS